MAWKVSVSVLSSSLHAQCRGMDRFCFGIDNVLGVLHKETNVGGIAWCALGALAEESRDRILKRLEGRIIKAVEERYTGEEVFGDVSDVEGPFDCVRDAASSYWEWLSGGAVGRQSLLEKSDLLDGPLALRSRLQIRETVGGAPICYKIAVLGVVDGSLYKGDGQSVVQAPVSVCARLKSSFWALRGVKNLAVQPVEDQGILELFGPLTEVAISMGVFGALPFMMYDTFGDRGIGRV